MCDYKVEVDAVMTRRMMLMITTMMMVITKMMLMITKMMLMITTMMMTMMTEAAEAASYDTDRPFSIWEGYDTECILYIS